MLNYLTHSDQMQPLQQYDIHCEHTSSVNQEIVSVSYEVLTRQQPHSEQYKSVCYEVIALEYEERVDKSGP